MIFLIEYDRQTGNRVTFEKFLDSERTKAEKMRREIESNLNRSKISHEVVILEATTENTLKRTHGRYFKTFDDLSEFKAE